MRPTRTPQAVLARLSAKAEELSKQRHREAVQRLVPIQRYACEEHRWHPAGPGATDMEALRSSCPHCHAARRQARREQEAPETRSIELNPYQGSVYAQKMWERQQQLRAQAGEILPGSTAEKEAVRFLDNVRADELDELHETAVDRRRRNAAYWGRRLGLHRHQRYEPHPARAGD